jgi:hypothetical protein
LFLTASDSRHSVDTLRIASARPFGSPGDDVGKPACELLRPLGLALERRQIGEHVGDGLAVEILIAEGQPDVGLEKPAGALACAMRRVTPLRLTISSACSAMKFSRAFAASPARFARAFACRPRAWSPPQA